MNQNHYTILGVPRLASADEIRKAFRSLSRLHHPDVAKDNKSSMQIMLDINESYAVLSDEKKRKEYDDALSKALVTNLPTSVAQVVGEYFHQFHTENTK